MQKSLWTLAIALAVAPVVAAKPKTEQGTSSQKSETPEEMGVGDSVSIPVSTTTTRPPLELGDPLAYLSVLAISGKSSWV